MSQTDRLAPSSAPVAAQPRSWAGRHKLLTSLLLILFGAVMFAGGLVVGQSGAADDAVNKAKDLAGVTPSDPDASPAASVGPASKDQAATAPQSSASAASGGAPPATKYSGTGDSIVKISKPVPGVVLMAVRHDAATSIEITEVSEIGNQVVYAPDGKYRGTVLLDDSGDEETSQLRVSTDGPWQFSLSAPSSAPVFSTELTGSGDTVAMYTGPGGTLTSTFKGKANFLVNAHKDQGNTSLVNTIGDYTGQEVMPPGPELVTIDTAGTWTLSVAP